ncbi:LysR family transcriptional regulator [Halopseudomonas pachastrellae]|uniref:HTH-type transcriptional regulator TrpI n=1 Tax=Halopseudomonas pachastrellae TaxID=254161 RepID=A0A1S8DGY5_9GAMM|nr:LysR family transcriptional regulator [Halopseudomonas pachastrellae]ONM44708.1 LysR family transcriptional regulator [Halopseudomonas pachastrellae]SFM29210.1 DNA-binding transcriptional regulator, LysR family [Halopseudomonas pachastrellae]
MRRKIPPTQALVCFESSARHESFTKAAEELSLTQSAVCRQIANLEAFLDIQLFRRTRRGVKLTDAGHIYSRRIASRLDAVERDTLSVMGNQGTATLEVALVPTFGTQWLLPRLGHFLSQHPQITVNLTNRTRPFLFADTEFDAAIYFGDGDWSGTQTHYLMPEAPIPVCSPALIAPASELSPDDIARLPLLQQTTRPYAWRQWFAAADMRVEHDLNGTRLELFSMLAQAAMHGMGVALIPPFLIRQELADGRLISPCPRSFETDNGYYLVIPERKAESAALLAFRDWILQQAHAWVKEAANLKL